MRFGLPAIFYAVAVVGAAIATFGPCGIVPAGLVLLFWGSVESTESPQGMLRSGACLCAVCLCAMCCLGLLLPATGNVRESARMNVCTGNMQQIGTAIRCYREEHGSFPPAYLADEDGRPMHSWRVLLLPYLEEISLYKQYDFGERWDGPNNSRLVNQAPTWFRCPSLAAEAPPRETSYVAIVGPNTMWPGASPPDHQTVQEIGDQTLLIAEAPHTGIHWMEPRDLTAKEFLRLHPANGDGPEPYHDSVGLYLSYSRLWNGLQADGSATSFDAAVARDVIEARTQVDGGEKRSSHVADGEPRHYWRWGQIISLTTFMALLVLPTIRLPKHDRQSNAPRESEVAETEAADDPA